MAGGERRVACVIALLALCVFGCAALTDWEVEQKMLSDLSPPLDGGFTCAVYDGWDSSEPLGTVMGIDIGSVYSLASVWNKGVVQIIADESGARMTPTYVAFTDDGDVLVGNAAREQAAANPANTVFDARFMLGRTFYWLERQHAIAGYPFKVVPRENMPVVEVQFGGETKRFRPEEILAFIVRKLKADAERYLGKRVYNAVVTVPAHFSDAQRRALREAVYLGGLQPVRMVNEPVAAAIAYGLDRVSDGETTIMVYDVDERTTFDVTVLVVDHGIFGVLAIAGTRSGYVEFGFHPSDPLGPILNVLDDADISMSDVDKIVLIGDTVFTREARHFFDDASKLVSGINPGEAVAYGAAVQAGVMAGEEDVDIGIFDTHDGALGRAFLVQRADWSLEDVISTIEALNGSLDATFVHAEHAVSAETSRRLRYLRDDVEERFWALGSAAPEDLKIDLDRNALIDVVGESAVVELEALWAAGSGGNYTHITVRRCCARGKHINLHTDFAARTMQVALNDDDEYDGGRLVYLNRYGVHVPRRGKSTVTIHRNDIVHGVTELISGTRYGLFFLAR